MLSRTDAEVTLKSRTAQRSTLNVSFLFRSLMPPKEKRPCFISAPRDPSSNTCHCDDDDDGMTTTVVVIIMVMVDDGDYGGSRGDDETKSL